MFKIPESVRVLVGYGCADQFWDVSFYLPQSDFAGVEADLGELKGISVSISTETGEIELNPGYMPGSPEDEDERNLFDTFREAIIEVLAHEVRADIPDYTAFLTRAKADQEARHEALLRLAAEMADTD